jgi:hypothetical protein
LLLSLLILGLFFYWFVVANRYTVFLYGHAGAAPFDATTTSRYWMAGLVAAGAVLVGEVLVNWYAGRIFGLFKRLYRVPDWRRVWWWSAPFVSTGIIVITLVLGQPPLPVEIAVLCVVSTLAGLALALPFSSLAADRLAELVWLLLSGIGLLPPLLLLRFFEPSIEQSARATPGPLLSSFIIGGGWLIVLTLFRTRRRLPAWSVGRLFSSGLCWSYVLMPLGHYLLLTPPQYHYITVAANFFAPTFGLQVFSCGLAFLMALGAVSFQRWLFKCGGKRQPVSR